MDTITTITTEGEGNTIPPPRKNPSLRRACFTLNNYTEEEFTTLLQKLQDHKYIIGKEVGARGTRHLQGYIELNGPKKFSTLQNILPRAHIEKCVANRASNVRYCMKDGDYVTNFPEDRKARILKKEYGDIVWKPWQQNIIDILDGKPDSRTIHWVYERVGNVGKSFLCKYLCLTRDVILCDGKKDNIFNQVKAFIDEHPDKDPSIILLDIPRSCKDFVNYGVIEQLKNGCIYSGKYEGGQCLFENPHVIAFANTKPNMMEVSMDRWNIINLGDDYDSDDEFIKK